MKFRRKKLILSIIFSLIIFVLLLFTPKLYYAGNISNIKETNEYLSLLDRRLINETRLDSFGITNLNVFIYALKATSQKDKLLYEINNIKENGKANIASYVEEVEAYLGEYDFEILNINYDELEFSDLKNSNEFINNLKEKLRAEVDQILNLYYELDIEKAISEMTEREKIGQLFSFALIGTSLSNSEKQFLAENNIGGVALFGNNIVDESQLTNLTNEIQLLNNRYPVFISTEQEGGTVKRLSWDPISSHKEIVNLSEEEQCNSWIKREEVLIESGINWNL